MKEKFTKKLFGKSSPKSWKPPYPSSPVQKVPQPQASNSETTQRKLSPRERFEPIISRPIELEKVTLHLHDADGEREIKTCYGDIYKIVNALMDYARLLELACDEWDLQGFHRATYEYHAKKLRAIAKKYQVGIGYDYDVTVAKCEAKKKKPHKDDDIGGDAMELALKQARRQAQKEEKTP